MPTPTNGTAAPDEEPENKPAHAPRKASTESGIEKAMHVAEEVEEAVSRSKSPFAAIAALVLPLIAGGGALGYNGYSASAEARSQYIALTQKVDELTKELVETRKELAAAATRAAAERHEERIRDTEKALQTHDLELARLRLELEALKKGK